MYWGYNVRVANKFEDVFNDCPFEEGYDIRIGISDNGDISDLADFGVFKGFRHALVFFGGLEGIEGLFE